MASLNQVQIIGNLGKDPEIRSMNNGNRIANFSVACSETWRDKNSGERKEKTEWVNVSCFSEGLVKVIEQYVKKGSKVFVQGKFSTRKWQDQSGQDRYSTEVVMQGFESKLILLSANPNSERQDGGGYSQQSTQRQAPQQNNRSEKRSFTDDDEIPF